MSYSKRTLFAAVCVLAASHWCSAGVVQIYWAWNSGGSVGGVERVDAAGNGRELLTSPNDYPAGIDIDPRTGKIYYTLAGAGDIRRCDLDGGDNVLLNGDAGTYVRGIELDVTENTMYWIAGHPGNDNVMQVLRANLNGSGKTYLYEPADGTNELTGISLDLTSDIVYWADYGSRSDYTDGAIGYGSLDGSTAAVVTEVGGDPRGVAVDPVGGKVYWTDFAQGGSGTIYRANLDFTDVTPLITNRTGPYAVTLDLEAGKIYWSDGSSGGSMYRADLADGGNIETLVTNVGARPSAIALVHDNLPTGWTAEDVGTATRGGFTIHDPATGRYVMESVSAGVGGSSDAFQYAHQTYDTGSEDFTAMVRLWSQENTDGSATAGLMARDGTGSDAAFVMTAGTPQNGVQLQTRNTSGTETIGTLAGSPNTAKDGASPVWLILRRRGDTFSSYYAEDLNGKPGVWSDATIQTATLPAAVQLGLAVSSSNTSSYGTGIFDNVKMGNWEPRAEVEFTTDGKFVGAAYALDDLNGDGTLANDEVVGAQWKLESLTPHSGLLSQWFMGKSSADWSGPTDYYLVASEIQRASSTYPQEIVDGEGITGGLDHFAVKYSGQIYVDHTGTVAFQESVDDHAQLYIDGTRIINNTAWDVDATATVALTEGWHDIEFYTWDGSLGDKAYLNWDPAGGTDWTAVTDDVLQFSLMGEGTWAVGDTLSTDLFHTLLPAQASMYRLTVNYLGEEISLVLYAPEPSSWLLLAIGAIAFAARRRRKCV